MLWALKNRNVGVLSLLITMTTLYLKVMNSNTDPMRSKGNVELSIWIMSLKYKSYMTG